MAGPRRVFATSPALVLAIETVADAVGVTVDLNGPTGVGPTTPTTPTDPDAPAPAPTPAVASQFHYVHTQDAPSTIWDVVHPLRYRPAAVTVHDDAGDVWWPLVEWIDDQHAQLLFPQAVRGRADLS